MSSICLEETPSCTDHDAVNDDVLVDSEGDVAVHLSVAFDADLLHDGALAAEQLVFRQWCGLRGVHSRHGSH